MSAKGAATRDRLLAAALALIPELGWGAVTTRAVAERAGVNPGLVHYHFPTVPDLLTAAALTFCRTFGNTWLDQLTNPAAAPAPGSTDAGAGAASAGVSAGAAAAGAGESPGAASEGVGAGAGAAAELEAAAGADTAAGGLGRLLAQLDAYPPEDPANRLMAEVMLAAPRHPDLRAGLSELITDLRARLADWLRVHQVRDPDAVAALALAAVEGIAMHRAIGAAADTGTYVRALVRLAGLSDDAII